MTGWPVTVVFLAGYATSNESHIGWSQSVAREVSRSTEWLTAEFVEWAAKLRVRRALREAVAQGVAT